MMNEHCWILVGSMKDDLWWAKRVRPTEGAPASVAFDPEYVIKRDAEFHDIVGFFHTHPSFTAHYSSRDDRTMKAWVTCLGKPLVCCILGIDGLRAWWYLNDEDPPVEYQAKKMHGVLFGLTPEEFFDEEETEEVEEFEARLVERVDDDATPAESGIESGSESCKG